jgi:hypothetical protein
MGLSPPVAAAVGPAVSAVLRLIDAERRQPSSPPVSHGAG